jgi:hypothetical protein
MVVLVPLINTLLRIPELISAGSGGGMPLHSTDNKVNDGQQAVSGNGSSQKNGYRTIQWNLHFNQKQNLSGVGGVMANQRQKT